MTLPAGSAPPPIRLLTFTTLFPHRGTPNHGVFVENRLRHLLSGGGVVATVMAPVPWFPAVAARAMPASPWVRQTLAEPAEMRGGLRILHPRYPVIPRFGMTVAPALLYAASVRAIRAAQRDGLAFDVIDAHYLYPDGVAAVALGQRFGVPVVITARGSDVTQLPDYPVPRRLIRWAMARADALISVSAGLKMAMVALGADPSRITVLRNGVDLAMFQPLDRDTARAALGLDGPTLLSVGLLNERKGHQRVIAALPELLGWQLLIVGDGPDRGKLLALAQSIGVADRVRMVGSVPHAALPEYYSAADALVLASSREGWANVLLESMACGTPVVASPIPGNPEVVQEVAGGVIMPENSGSGIAAGVRSLLEVQRPRAETRAYAERFSWDATTAGQMAVFRRVLAARQP